MQHSKKRVVTAAVFILGVCFVGASIFWATGTGPKEKAELTISAAASLKEALTEIKTLYSQTNPGVAVTLNFGSSGTLAQQIEQGAKVDLFISAAEDQMASLQDQGLLEKGTVKNIVGNQLVLVVPLGSTLSDNHMAAVLDPSVKKLALGEPKSVPAGQYAEEVLTYFDLLGQVKDKAVYGKDAREVLTWVETENVEAAMVYATDALISKKVKVLATAPEGSHRPILYPAAVIAGGSNLDVARDFLEYLSSEDAKTVFKHYGFTPL